MEQVTIVEATKLKLDYALYPRQELNTQHVADLRAAIAAGALLPPIIADQKSRRVVDGFHRTRAFLRGSDAKVQVIWRTYPNEREMFLDAVRLNAAHGAKLTHLDVAHCIILGKELKLTPVQLAEALHLTPDYLQKVEMRKIATNGNGRLVPIKRLASHLAGTTISHRQVVANGRAIGTRQQFLVLQVVNLIKGDLVDPSDEDLLESLHELLEVLKNYLTSRPDSARRPRRGRG